VQVLGNIGRQKELLFTTRPVWKAGMKNREIEEKKHRNRIWW
jgi:hypothetical protein